MNESKEYIAFISYRHTPLDKKAAKQVQKSIEGFTVPKELRKLTGGKRLGQVFRDEDELPASSSLSNSITDALDHSRYLIVICTPDLPKSPWCEKEIRYFLETHDRDHLLAVLVDGEPEESFSPYMLHTYDADGQILDDVEPLAANIAGKNHTIDQKKYRKEIFRTYAALIGCPFDALWQRARRARTNALIGLVSGIALVMAGFMTVVLLKNRQITQQNVQIQQQNDQILEKNEQITEQNDQITRQNEELADQKLELEKRVSKALVETGLTKLQDFDVKGAIEDGLAAVDNEDAAVYDPQAEKLLSDALHTYVKDGFYSEVVYRQANDIIDMQISDDGRFLVLLDSGGTIRCLQVEDYTSLWEIRTGDKETKLYLQGQQDRVLYKNKQGLFCAAAADGSTIWEYIHQAPNQFQAISEDGTWFALMDRLGDGYPSQNPVHVLFLNTEDGSERLRSDLDTEEYEEKLFDSYSAIEFGGAFSKNKEWFYCSYPASEAASEESIPSTYSLAWMVNTKTGERTDIFRLDPPDFFSGFYVSDDGNEVFYACQNLQFGGVLSGMSRRGEDGRFPDPDTPKLISQDVNSPDGGATLLYEYMNDPRVFTMLASKEESIICSDDRLILLNTQTGSLSKSISMTGNIRMIRWLDAKKTAFEFVTSDGLLESISIAPGSGSWYKQLRNYEIDQDDILLAVPIGGSLHPVDSERNLQFDLNAEYLTVRKTHPGQILKVSRLSDPDGEEVPMAKRDIDRCSGIYLPEGTDYGMMVCNGQEIVRFDRNTGEETGSASFEENSLNGREYQILDENSLLYKESVFYLDGSTKSYGEGYVGSWDQRYPSVHKLLYNGQILSLRPGVFDAPDLSRYANHTSIDATLTPLWLDGDLIETSAKIETGMFVHEAQMIASDTDNYDMYETCVGSNGLVMQYGRSFKIDGIHLVPSKGRQLVIFDALDGSRKEIEDPCPEDGSLIAALGTRTHVAAIVYETGRAGILNTDTEEMTFLENSYAAGEVVTLGFTEDDAYLLLQTRAGYVDIYDVAAGSRVFSEALSALSPFPPYGTSGGTISAVILPERHLMILDKRFGAGGEGDQVILNMDTWSVVATVSNVYALDPQTQRFYTSRGVSASDKEIIGFPLYDLSRLKAKAQDRLKAYQKE